MNVFPKRTTRRGAAIAMVAILLPVILGVLGFCIDAGVTILAHAHLTTAADAAALAGAYQLNDPGRVAPNYNLIPAISAAQSKGLAIGRGNTVLGQKAVLLDNSSNDPGGDVVIGYIDLTTPKAPLVTDSGSSAKFNSVQVTARRSTDHGGKVPSFFSRLMGFGDQSLFVQSTATVQNYAVSGFKCTPAGQATRMIPIALSLPTYGAMLSQLTTDQFTYNPWAGTVLVAPDGLYESSLYPSSSGSGNWGTLRIGVNNNGTSVLSNQIQNGLTTDEIGSTFGCSLALNASTPSVQVSGNPGLSLGLKPALQSLVGKTVVVPIYDPTGTTGNGSNLSYKVVNFAPVAVLSTTFAGIHSQVIVQPTLINDTTAVAGAPQSSWASGGLVRLHLSR